MIKATPEEIKTALATVSRAARYHEERDGWGVDLMKAWSVLNAALNVAPAGEIEQKPVAWRVKDYADGWILYGDKADPRALAASYPGQLVQPLYAAPPSTVPVAREALVEAEKLLREPQLQLCNGLGDELFPALLTGIVTSEGEFLENGNERDWIERRDAALAKIKSALAATDNPSEGK